MKTSVAVGAFGVSVVVGYVLSGWLCKVMNRANIDTSRVVSPGNMNVRL